MATREGSLDAPTRHPLDWQAPDFWNRESLRRSSSGSSTFATAAGAASTCAMPFPRCSTPWMLPPRVSDGVPKAVFADVVDHCYLCDMCYMSKCPYVPPHPFNVDFPHPDAAGQGGALPGGGAPLRSRLLSATDQVGSIAGIPVIAEV